MNICSRSPSTIAPLLGDTKASQSGSVNRSSTLDNIGSIRSDIHGIFRAEPRPDELSQRAGGERQNAGWGGRIRTCECRYQNPVAPIFRQPKTAEICG